MSILAPRHAVPLVGSYSHSASNTCKCAPIASYRDLATGAPVYRHREPAPRQRVDPTVGESYPVPPREALPTALRETLDAVADGADTPQKVAHRLGIHPLAAKARLLRLHGLGVPSVFLPDNEPDTLEREPDNEPDTLEREPDNEPDTAQRLTIPDLAKESAR